MFEKNLEINYLLDFYGEVLPERKRIVLEYYYNDDYSLSEIADQIGISRQGVRDIIKKAEEELLYLEEKLNLYKKFKSIQLRADELISVIDGTELPDDIKAKIYDFAEEVRLSI